MRIIAGSARGRRISVPDSGDVRPTADRVREATFNALGSLGGVVGSEVLDLFAGSGAMGLEALSRGAAHATFVESNHQHRIVIGDNVVQCGFGDSSNIVGSTAETYLASLDKSWDLVILDPPYAYEGWADLLDSLDSDVVVIESDRSIELPSRWRCIRERSYGSTVVIIATSREPRDSPDLVESQQ